jgi:hypothetical protein
MLDAVAITNGGVATGEYASAIAYGFDYGNGGTWTLEMTAKDEKAGSGLETWATSPHPRNTEFASSFIAMRRVSMGLKLVNVSDIVDRGGVVFVSYTMSIPVTGTAYTDDLMNAVETQMYDAARLKAEGLSAVYLPITSRPLNMTGDAVSLPACSYVNPSATHATKTTITDMYIVIWTKAKSEEALSFIIEQTDNYEALPYPEVEFMYERETVKSSPQEVAVAMEMAAPPTASATVEAKGGNSAFSTVGKIAGSAVKAVAHAVMPQVASRAMKFVASLPGMLFGLDFKHHRLACLHNVLEISPGNCAEMRGLSDEEFLSHIIAALSRKTTTTKETKLRAR